MLHLNESESPQVAFEALSTGIHVFLVRHATNATPNFTRESSGTLTIQRGEVEDHFVTYLQFGEELRHNDHACDLYGVRLGDEV